MRTTDRQKRRLLNLPYSLWEICDTNCTLKRVLQIELIIDGAAKEIAKSGLAKEEHAATLDSAASETARAQLPRLQERLVAHAFLFLCPRFNCIFGAITIF